MATITQITSDPRFGTATPEQKQRLIARAEDAPQSFKDKVLPVVKQAGREAIATVGGYEPDTVIQDLETNPVTQAKAVVPLAGTLGAMSPIPMGTTIGTVGARKLSNAALDAYGRPEEKPSGLEQAGEAALSLAGDAFAVPGIKSKLAGKAIGEAEGAAGITQDTIRRLPPPGSIRTAVVLLNKLKDKLLAKEITPLAAREIKPALDTIATKGWLKGTEYMSDFGHVSNQVTKLVNEIPGRGEAASQMRSAKFIPNLAKKTWNAIPNPVRRGFGYAVGGGLGIDALHEVLGDRGGR